MLIVQRALSNLEKRMAQMIGDRYELIEQIGSGGMGKVYRGVEISTGQVVAIKELKQEVVQENPELVGRFAREGEILRTLNHPNIVKMLAMVEDNGQQYLVMEYISG